MKPIFICDLDDSLVDYSSSMCKILNNIKHPLEADITRDTLHELVEEHPYIKARKDLISMQPGFWINLRPVNKGIKVWKKAVELGFDMVVATQVPKSKPIAAKEKHEWVVNNLGEDVDFMLTRRKELVFGHILYDDYPDYVEKWLNQNLKGYAIMPQYHFNKDYAHPRCIRHTDENFETIAGFLEDMVKVYG